MKKFARETFDIRGGPQDGDAQTFYDLLTATFGRRGLLPHPRAYIQHVFDRFVQRGLARVLFLVREGAVVAGNITATYKGGAQYLVRRLARCQGERGEPGTRGSSNHGSQGGGSEFFETGQAYLSGDDQALRGISDFKRSFGSALYPLFQGSIIVRPRMYAALQLVQSFRAGR